MKFVQPSYTRIFYGFLLALGLVWTWLSATPQNATTKGKIPAPQKGFLAPDFTLTTLDGQAMTLSELRGKAILLNMWASWCPPCRAEMPAIERTYQAFKDQQFAVLAVNSTVQDALPALEAFIGGRSLTFPILLDETGEVTRLYRIQSLPTSFFIDADGMIREVVVGGPMTDALLRSRVEELLKEAR